MFSRIRITHNSPHKPICIWYACIDVHTCSSSSRVNTVSWPLRHASVHFRPKLCSKNKRNPTSGQDPLDMHFDLAENFIADPHSLPCFTEIRSSSSKSIIFLNQKPVEEVETPRTGPVEAQTIRSTFSGGKGLMIGVIQIRFARTEMEKMIFRL